LSFYIADAVRGARFDAHTVMRSVLINKLKHCSILQFGAWRVTKYPNLPSESTFNKGYPDILSWSIKLKGR
jgi:hypothetical protein